MDLVRHLEYFAAIAHERHFGRAAQRLGIRQPPLSQGLKRLENELGVYLFHRDSQAVTLTDAGQALLPAAHRVLDEVEQLRLLARRQEEPSFPRVTVRVAPGLGAGHYAALVAACYRAAPGAAVDVTEQNTSAQVTDLLEDRADVGVLREPVVARGITLGPRVRVPFHAVVPAQHSAARAGEVPLRRLSGHGLVIPPRDQAPAAHDELLATCERHGFLPDTVHEIADERMARGLVASGEYVGFTTDRPGVHDDTAVVALADEPLTFAVRTAWHGALPDPVAHIPASIVAALVRHGPADAAGRTGRPRAASELPVAPAAQTVQQHGSHREGRP